MIPLKNIIDVIRCCVLHIRIIDKTTLLIMFVCLMVFDATFNNISVISWQSILLVEESGGPGENHKPVASRSQLTLIEIRTHNISGDR